MTVTANRKQKLVAQLRREEILAAATRVFGAKGFEATRMDDVAAQAKLAKGTLYLYYKSKRAVYTACVQQAVGELQQQTEQAVEQAPDLRGKLRAFIETRMAYWAEHANLYRMILSISGDLASRRRNYALMKDTHAYLTSLLEAASQRGELNAGIDASVAAWMVFDIVRGVNERQAVHGTRVDGVTETAIALLLNGLCAEPPAL